MVLLAKTAVLRLLGLLLLFVPAFFFFPRLPGPISPGRLGVGVGNGVCMITAEVSVWELGLWAGFRPHRTSNPSALPSAPGWVSWRLSEQSRCRLSWAERDVPVLRTWALYVRLAMPLAEPSLSI